MSRPALVLIGAPAAGKTTVGRIVAERAGLGFSDTDELVEARLGFSLSEAWASLPPERIAEAEVAACQAALGREGVVALGSAAVAHLGLRALLAGLPVVWLQVSATQATRRLGMSALGMDALLSLRARLDSLLRERQGWYEQSATLRLDTDRLDVQGAVTGVERLWKGA